MRRFSTVWLVAFAAALVGASGSGRAQSAISTEITNLERSWEKAMNAKDGATVEGIMASGWVGLNPDGSKDTRAHFVAAVKNGDYATVKLDDIAVSVFGATAIAHGKAHDKDNKYVYSDVFVQEGGKWRAVFSQLGVLQPPPPPAKK
jgi:ketosteroid isomerase-like protein